MRATTHAHPADRLDPDVLTTTFYTELRHISRRMLASERPDHTLQPTAVTHEACMRLMEGGLPDVPREERLALAARVLRQVLVDHARARGAQKRGGGAVRVEVGDALAAPERTIVDAEALHAALDRLRELNERQSDVITLRVYAGLTMRQIADVLGVSRRTVENDWTVARAWLRRELARAGAVTP